MKTIRNVTKLFPAIILGAALAWATLPARAVDYINVPSDLASVVNGTSNSVSGTAFEIVPNKDYGIAPCFAAAGNGTSNVIYGFHLRIGTNWTTICPVYSTNSANNSTAVVGWTPIYRTNLIGASALRLGQVITTQTNAVTTTQIPIDALK